MNGEVRVVDDVTQAFADLVAAEAPPTIALSGGNTARRSYEQLAKRDVDWSNISVLIGDERWVPVDDPDSNEGMARRALLDQARPREIHSMRNASDTPDAVTQGFAGVKMQRELLQFCEKVRRDVIGHSLPETDAAVGGQQACEPA